MDTNLLRALACAALLGLLAAAPSRGWAQEEVGAEASSEPVDQEEAARRREPEPEGAPSPAEEAEALLYGRPSRVEYRDQLTDRQGPAARPEDFVFDPEFRGYIPIPRTVFLIQFNAQPRVDLNASSKAPGSEFRFVPSLFPIVGQPGYSNDWRFDANANGTQLRLDLRSPATDGSFRFYYQNDFFGSDTRNMQYRLQHLYGQYYGVVGGFTYGLFENPDAWPDTVDYEGPNSVIFARRALLHYQRGLTDDWQITVGIEDPDNFVDTTSQPTATPRSRAPDGGLNVRWTPGELGHVQVGAIFRSIGVDGSTLGSQDVFGWGINLSGAIDVTRRDTVVFWFNYGEGIGGMGNDTSFQNSDAAFDLSGRLHALEYWSTLGAFTHHWTPRWRSTVTYGYVNLENTSAQSPYAYNQSHYASANVIYQVFKRLSVGAEGLWGRKEVNVGLHTDVWRTQVTLTYKFFD